MIVPGTWSDSNAGLDRSGRARLAVPIVAGRVSVYRVDGDPIDGLELGPTDRLTVCPA